MPFRRVLTNEVHVCVCYMLKILCWGQMIRYQDESARRMSPKFGVRIFPVGEGGG